MSQFFDILAIDPGTTESAVVRWNGSHIFQAAIVSNSLVERFLFGSVVLCEMVACYGMPVGREVFETCLWIGEFRAICRERAQPFQLVYRRDVKLHHCGSVRAKDANVIQALKDKYGDKGTKANPGTTYGLKSHMWQAFAIATAYAEKQKEGELTQ